MIRNRLARPALICAGAFLVAGCRDPEDIRYRSGNQAKENTSEAVPSASPGTFIDIDAGQYRETSGSGEETQGLSSNDESASNQGRRGLSDDELALEPEVGTPVESMAPPITERSALPDEDGYTELDWDELLPPDFSFDPWLDQVDLNEFDLTTMDDTDPEAQRLYDELKRVLSDVPSNEALAGVAARLPGFMVPIDFDGQQVRRFLLVPYFGACIHTPPPPANQMVYVEYPEGFDFRQLYEPVMVSGTFELERHQDEELGTAGYSMTADNVRLF